MYVVIAPTYASEVLPLALRGYLNAYVNLCFVIGQLLANGVSAGTQGMDNHWAYSIPFSLQWFWIAVLTPGLLFIPESPWWLARQGRLEDATKSLRRLVSRDVDVATTLAIIVNTDRLEQELQAGVTFFDCLRGTNRRRTEISIGVATAQVFSGIYLINYGTYFFQQAGLATDQAFNMGVAFLGRCV
jgi:MFS family permease